MVLVLLLGRFFAFVSSAMKIAAEVGVASPGCTVRRVPSPIAR